MAYRVMFPSKILILISFLISLLMFLTMFLIMSGKSWRILIGALCASTPVPRRCHRTKPPRGPKTPPRCLQDASRTPSNFHHFFNAFFDRFWLRFPSQLGPQNPTNWWKIDAEMTSHVDLIFGSIFYWFLLPTSTPRTWKIEPPLQREHDFSKNRLSKLTSILIDFWYQLASIFVPKFQ